MKGREVVVSLVAGFLSGSCTASGNRAVDPPAPRVLREGGIVVVAPVIPPEDLAIPDSTLGNFPPLIEQYLSSAGVVLVNEATYSKLWEDALKQVGDVFDSLSGERDETRFELARDKLYTDLKETYQAEVVLYPEIWIVDAPFADGVAKWDGNSEPLVGVGTRIFDAIGAVFGSGSQLPSGTVPALSLVVFAEDMRGEEVFSGWGGIQVIEKVGTRPDDISLVPDEQLLLNPVRNRNAVELALSLLSGQP